MWGWVARGVWWALGAVFSGFKAGLGAFLGQVFLSAMLAGLGIFFKDWILDWVTYGLNFAINGINNLGLDIPSVAEMFDLLPLPVLQAMVRVDVAACITIVTSALAARGVMGLFKFSRGAKALAAAQ